VNDPVDSADPLHEMADREAIRTLQARYADLVARRAWAELVELYVPEMPFELDLGPRGTRSMVGPNQVGVFLDASVARFDFFTFVPVNTVIELYPGGDRDAATARFWMREDRHEAGVEDHAAGWSSAHGLYRDTYARVGDRWWFAERHYRSLARTGPDSTVLEFPDLD
jgi:hypothetical protein